MASTLQKLLRKTTATRIITAFHNSRALSLAGPLAFERFPSVEINRECRKPTNLSPVKEDFNSSRSTMIFPSFPFGFVLNPVSSIGVFPPEAEDVELDDSRKMWADSVKKKRKRKMNKHKYQKLRKRMRRQT
ncbi:hypothetical protein L6164_008983 [Bauhinia variegata]|uniref:Uncharacterized protein n=1 Tax=Bauhinia variegata TaxID=167791 RepID=A0ACB9PID9_BAUVA|nr:hypothetical protein L6164_008983 [Bauhinia variegata]